jgi:parallel beta-helix repeat protein
VIRFPSFLLAAIGLLTLWGWLHYSGLSIQSSTNQAVNRMAYYRDGSISRFGQFLLAGGVTRDWNTPGNRLHPAVNSTDVITQSSEGYTYQHYSAQGQPLPSIPGDFSKAANTRQIDVTDEASLYFALGSALPGDIITLSAGAYLLEAKSIPINRPGRPDAPIYLRAEQVGSAVLSLSGIEGFHVMAPFWVFENLEVRGVCEEDQRCEHAFHVVGEGRSFTLRGSRLIDFNAPVKVNPSRSKMSLVHPDHGLIEYNYIFNTRPRNTVHAVTLININSASDWVVRHNYIADFAKSSGDWISYGAFMKGNGGRGVFEGNVVVCENSLPADRGLRIGLSFGGGGTQIQFCRHGSCATEHRQGRMLSNTIVHCSHDVGIYLNRSADTVLKGNLLNNNLGIDLRHDTSFALITDNILSGRIRERAGAQSCQSNNYIAQNCFGSNRKDCAITNSYASSRHLASPGSVGGPRENCEQVEKEYPADSR